MSQTERALHDLDTKTMPLTQVSLEYGSEGLAFRLQQAIGKIGLKAHELELVQESMRLGLDLHKNDARTYEPYVNHLLRVALRLIEDLEVYDPVTIAAALLHDSIEDHSDELAKRYGDHTVSKDPRKVRALGVNALRIFAARYNAPEIADIVLSVSNPILEPGEDKNASYIKHVVHLMQKGSLPTRRIKIADVLDNMDIPPDLENREILDRLDPKHIGIIPSVEAELTKSKDKIPAGTRDAALYVLADRREAAMARIAKRHDRKSA